MSQGQFLNGVKQVRIQSFPSRLVASPSLKNLVCPTILPIAGGRRVLVQCEMQSVSSRIWTRVAVSISYDDNHYTINNYLNWNSSMNVMMLVLITRPDDNVIYISKEVSNLYISWPTQVEGNSKSLFSIVSTQRCKGGRYCIPWIVPLTLDQYLRTMNVKQGGIKYWMER